MADTLGWRLKLGVLVPSTNTSVQPEYDAMRPPGVTNHVRGFRIPNAPTRTDAEFERQLENMRASMVDAMDEVLTLEPDHVILATAAESSSSPAYRRLPRLAGPDRRVRVGARPCRPGGDRHLLCRRSGRRDGTWNGGGRSRRAPPPPPLAE